MKICIVCNIEKEDNFFYIRRRDEKPYGACKDCQFRASKERFRSYKEMAVNYLGGKCSKCGYSRCLGALEFYHKDPKEKDTDYRKMRNWSFEAKKKELDKCVLLCANCHREVEAGFTEL